MDGASWVDLGKKVDTGLAVQVRRSSKQQKLYSSGVDASRGSFSRCRVVGTVFDPMLMRLSLLPLVLRRTRRSLWIAHMSDGRRIRRFTSLLGPDMWMNHGRRRVPGRHSSRGECEPSDHVSCVSSTDHTQSSPHEMTGIGFVLLRGSRDIAVLRSAPKIGGSFNGVNRNEHNTVCAHGSLLPRSQ